VEALEKRLAVLEGQIESQTKTIQEQNKTIESLSKQPKNVAVPETEKRIAALEKQGDSQTKTIQQQNKTIEALTKQLKSVDAPDTQEKEPPVLPTKSFTVDGREFKFVVAEFFYKGESMTAVDALTEKEVLAALVEKGSGVIQEVH
jgi:uncharacterized coiled-coil protein SlyX